jgi:cell division protein FtsL
VIGEMGIICALGKIWLQHCGRILIEQEKQRWLGVDDRAKQFLMNPWPSIDNF